MPNLFFIGDTHFNHTKLALIRGFTTVEEHDEALIDNWNKIVRKNDIIYHLGDVCFGGHEKLARLKGYKKLILGNHDNEKKLIPYFNRFYGALAFHTWVLTHIPVHPRQLEHRFSHNIHGHLHTNNIDDKQYVNVSAEQINLTPIALEELRKKIEL